MRLVIDNIYDAIGALSLKMSDGKRKDNLQKIGYQAIWERDQKND